MAASIKKCRVCGKDYEACRSMNRSADVFRWQEVACSPECGAEYLRRIAESRNPVPQKRHVSRKTAILGNAKIVESDTLNVLNVSEEASADDK